MLNYKRNQNNRYHTCILVQTTGLQETVHHIYDFTEVGQMIAKNEL